MIAWIARAVESDEVLNRTDNLILGSFSPEYRAGHGDGNQQKWRYRKKRIVSQRRAHLKWIILKPLQKRIPCEQPQPF